MRGHRYVPWGNGYIDVEKIRSEDGRIDPSTAHLFVRLIARACRIPHRGQGFLYQELANQLEHILEVMFPDPSIPTTINPGRRRRSKAYISRRLKTAVFERDAYRCRHCSGYLNLAVDHVVPECQGGPTTLENLQTLCREYNSRKGIKIPVLSDAEIQPDGQP